MFKLREPLLSDSVPLDDHVSDYVVILRDGSVLSLFEIDGLAWESVDPAEINGLHARWNLTIRNIGSERLVLTQYLCRGLVDPGIYPTGQFRSGFAEALDLAYRDKLLDRALYQNRIFLAVQIKPSRPAGEWFAEKAARRASSRNDVPEDRVRLLERVCDLLAADLQPYGARRLGVIVRGPMLFSEIGEAVACAVTGIWRPVPITTGRLGQAMFAETVTVGHEVIALRGPGWTTYAATLGIKQYPTPTRPGMLDALLAAPYRFTLTQSFSCLSKSAGLGVLQRKQNKMVWAGDKACSQIAELDQASNDLMANRFIMGVHNFCLCVFGNDVARMDDVVTAAWRDLADAGMVAARDGKLTLMAAWLSQITGNARHYVRPGAISSRNYAAMVSLHNYPSGARDGHWGQPLAILRTAGGTPYRFHLHQGDSGNMFVSGRIGSGKSVFLAFIAAQAERTGAQVIIWDKDRGLEILTRALGGSYARLRNGEPNVAPLKALDGDKPSDMVFLMALARSAIMHRAEPGFAISQEEERRLAIGLAEVMRLPPEDRSWGEVRAFLGTRENGAGSRLEKWCWGRELGWVMDGPRHNVSLTAPVIGFDQTEILDNPDARGPILSILFYLCESLLDGRRLLFIIDEFWKSLLDPAFRDLVNDKLKTLRKRNSPMILATQSPRDALNSTIAHTIREQCPSQAYFANPVASWEDYGEPGMKCSRTEVGIVQTLTPGSGMFLLKQGTQSVVAQLPLAGLEDELAVLSGREANVRLLDGMPEAVLADPARMLAEFHRQRRGVRETA